MLTLLKGSHSEELKCKFVVQNAVYSCTVSGLNNSDVNMVIDGFTGDHMSSKSNADVRAIVIDDINTVYLPVNLGSLFNLKMFTLQHSKVYEVKAKHFLGMKSIEHLNLAGNKIKTLPSDVFSALTKLISINLSSNKIEFMNADTFDNLPNLRHVSLTNNICGNKKYDESSGITQLKKDIHRLCFTRTTPKPMKREDPKEAKREELVERIKKLEKELAIARAELKSLDDDDDDSADDDDDNNLICEFREEGDKATETDKGSMLYSCCVSTLDIQEKNMVIAGKTGVHKRNKNDASVKSIFINNTDTKYIPANLGKLFSLTSFIMKNTLLQEIESKNFLQMEKITVLELSHGKLKTIPENAFNALLELTKIDLSYNLLEDLGYVLETNTKLMEIFINNNRIKYLNMDFFGTFPNLNYVDLEGNSCLNKFYVNAEEIIELKNDVEDECRDPNE